MARRERLSNVFFASYGLLIGIMPGIFNKNKIKILSLLAAFMLLAGFYLLYIWFTRPPETTSFDRPADIKITSAELISSFQKDEEMASSIFVEKTIEVKGVVKDITFFNDRYTVLLQGGDSYSCIMCDMQNDQTSILNEIKKGDTIVLKGICKGFLMDAILLNCIIITNP